MVSRAVPRCPIPGDMPVKVRRATWADTCGASRVGRRVAALTLCAADDCRQAIAMTAPAHGTIRNRQPVRYFRAVATAVLRRPSALQLYGRARRLVWFAGSQDR